MFGDTNTTLGGAPAAAQRQLPLAYLEAELRSFDRGMPEERNRVVADLLFAPSAVAVRNLAAERLQARAAPIGDVMVDALAAMRARVAAASERYLPTHMRDGPFLLATAHRQGTTYDPARLAATLPAPRQVPLPVGLLAHPKLRDRAVRLGIPLMIGALQAGEPLPHPSMIAAMAAARGVITDSGGLQEEALLLGGCPALRCGRGTSGRRPCRTAGTSS